MAVIVFFLFIWLFCKAIKALFRPRRPRLEYQPETETKTDNSLSASLTQLDALQRQRQQINDTILYIKECITTAETPEKTIQYMDRLSSLYGKLATVENKIHKLMNN